MRDSSDLSDVIYNFLKAIPGWKMKASRDFTSDDINNGGIFFLHSIGDVEANQHFGYINFHDKFFINWIPGYKLTAMLRDAKSHAKMVELFDKWEK